MTGKEPSRFAAVWAAAIEEGLKDGLDQKVILDGLLDSVPETALAIERNLIRRMPSMLREHRQIRRRFEKRLWKRWRRAFDLMEAVIVASQELGEETGQSMGDADLGRQEVVVGVLREIHARACHVTYQVYALLRSGFPVGAEALLRTLHELDVVSSVIAKHGPDTAERYLAHSAIEDAKDAEQYQLHAAQLGQKPYTATEMVAIRQAAAAARAKHGNAIAPAYGWAVGAVAGRSRDAPSIADLEKDAGLAHFSPYRSFGNHRLHAGSKGLRLNRIEFRGEVMLRVMGTNHGFAEVGSGVLQTLGRVTVTLLLKGVPFMDRADGLIDPEPVILARTLLLLIDRAVARLARTDELLERMEAAVMADLLVRETARSTT